MKPFDFCTTSLLEVQDCRFEHSHACAKGSDIHKITCEVAMTIIMMGQGKAGGLKVGYPNT